MVDNRSSLHRGQKGRQRKSVLQKNKNDRHMSGLCKSRKGRYMRSGSQKE